MIYLIYLSDLFHPDHDLYDLSARSIWSRSWSTWSIFRSIWSVSWSILSMCPIYLIYAMINLSDPSDLYHDLSCLSVRSIWSRSWSIWYVCPIYVIEIMIYLVYLSGIPDLDHDLSDLSDPSEVESDQPDISVRSIWSGLSVYSVWSTPWSI